MFHVGRFDGEKERSISSYNDNKFRDLHRKNGFVLWLCKLSTIGTEGNASNEQGPAVRK